MMYSIYTVRDQKTGYLPPTYDQNDNSAMRNFSFACSRSDSTMSFSKADFDLFRIGVFDSETGLITLNDPVYLMNGLDCEA